MAATAVLGKVEEFDSSKEDWQQYVERLGHFFVVNGISSAEKKRAVFLCVIGASTYKILRNLVAPTKPGDKVYSALVEVLAKHYKPTPSEIVERCKFHSRFRKTGESVATFASELRSLSEFCNFGDTLEVMIRDRLVCGISDDAIQNSHMRSQSRSHRVWKRRHNVKELRAKSEQVNNSIHTCASQEVYT